MVTTILRDLALADASDLPLIWLPQPQRLYLPPPPSLQITQSLLSSHAGPLSGRPSHPPALTQGQVSLLRLLPPPEKLAAILSDYQAHTIAPSQTIRHASRAERPPAPSLLPLEPLVEPLSRREHDILCCIAAGFSNHEIAQRLSIAAGTVKWHIRNIYGKLGVQRRTQAIARARALQILD